MSDKTMKHTLHHITIYIPSYNSKNVP